MRLSSLHVYPVKSCAGLSPSSWPVDALGFQYDRRWMVTTPRGQFLTQREVPALALVTPEIRPPHLVLRFPGQPDLVTALAPMGGPVPVAFDPNLLRRLTPNDLGNNVDATTR